MKALFIVSKPIYPIMCGGQIRTKQQLEFLSNMYDVDVIFISDHNNPPMEPYYKFAKNVKFFYRPKIRSILGTLRFLFNRLPLQVNYFLDGKMKSYIDKVSDKYDLIFCNNIRTAEYARNGSVNGIVKVIDFVDCISMNYDKARHHSSGLMKLIYNIDFHRCRIYERLILNEFDSSSLISEVDKQYMLS